MKRFLLLMLTLVVIGGTTDANAQWIKKLGEKAKEAAKRKVEQKVEQKTEKAVDDVFEGNIGKGKKDKKNNNGADNGNEAYEDGEATSQEGGKQQVRSIEAAYAKSDFVAGDEIIFDDPMTNEQMGEFPSQWDLLNGTAEVASMDGLKCIQLEAGSSSTIAPLMKDMNSYLPDVFTVEFDYWVNSYTETNEIPSQNYRLRFYDAEGDEVMELEFAEGAVYWNYTAATGDRRDGRLSDYKEKINSWSHMAVSFNKRAFKAYINGSRVVNIPSMKAPVRLTISNTSWRNHRTMVTNFRLAKGAVPLYDRMMSDGKFITYGITFDVGKSTIKPESMGEINRIVQLMTENPDLKFSVEGHTDSTGNAASNQTLSEQRSQAIVAKLVELGIAQDRLTAVGKGQNNPIADNSTDEGRAKNRRVEFVKM
ncbi:OmpA family protein [Parabacteroides sp.]